MTRNARAALTRRSLLAGASAGLISSRVWAQQPSEAKVGLLVPISGLYAPPGAVLPHGADIGVSQRQFLRHDAGGKPVRAGTARIFGQRERTQPELRCFIEHVKEQGPRARL